MNNKLSDNKKGVIRFGDFQYEIDIPANVKKLDRGINLEENEEIEEQAIIVNEESEDRETILDTKEDEVEEPKEDKEDNEKNEELENIEEIIELENAEEKFINLGQIILENLNNENIGSKIRVGDIQNDISNIFNFEWQNGNHEIEIGLDELNEKQCRMYVEIKLPDEEVYMKKYTVSNIIPFNNIRFILLRPKLAKSNSKINMKNFRINEKEINEDVVFKSGIEVVDINCSSINNNAKFKLNFDLSILNFNMNTGISGDIEILFGNKR